MTYRHAGKARSPALDHLAAQGRAASPSQAHMVPQGTRDRRLELAAGVHGDRPTGAFLLALLFWMFALAGCKAMLESRARMTEGGQAFFAFIVIGTFASTMFGFVRSSSAETRRKAGVERMLTWQSSHPFPVHGLADWAVADRSVVIVHLSREIERTTFALAARAVDSAIETAALDGVTYELVMPARVHGTKTIDRFGDFALLQRTFEQLVLPLHGDVGVQSVALGGTIRDRAG